VEDVGAWSEDSPVAHTSLGASAVTAYRAFAPEPTFGVRTTFHDVPSQCIARPTPWLMSVLFPRPTAQASLDVMAATP